MGFECLDLSAAVGLKAKNWTNKSRECTGAPKSIVGAMILVPLLELLVPQKNEPFHSLLTQLAILE